MCKFMTVLNQNSSNLQSMSALHNINTLRYFATFLLVSYHVIGIDEHGGMGLGYPSIWRFAADALIDVRMPIFAFIAGVVYALRPLKISDISGFFGVNFIALSYRASPHLLFSGSDVILF